jgi:hypothetical protein
MAADASPYHVFEIERGGHGALAKSLKSLEIAHERYNSRITLIVPSARVQPARAMVPEHLRNELIVLSLESCLSVLQDLPRLAEVLGVPIGTRR